MEQDEQVNQGQSQRAQQRGLNGSPSAGTGAVQQGQPQPMSQDKNAMRLAQRFQEMLLQGANQVAQNATTQMAAVQSLAIGATHPPNQQVAKKQAEAAQNQKVMAHRIAAAA